MTESCISRQKTANMLGALATVLADRIRMQTNKALGLTGESVAAVVTVGANPGLLIGQLAKALGLTQSGGVRLVDRLATEGLLRREVGNDPRAAPLRLTAKGVKARRHALEARSNALNDALRGLDDQQSEQLAQLLEIVLSRLTGNVIEGYRICRLCNEEACVPLGCPVESRCQELQL